MIFLFFRLTVSTEASMMSRDVFMLIDLNGQAQFLTKLQVNICFKPFYVMNINAMISR